MSKNLACLVYVSTATHPFSAADMQQIIDVAEKNNKRDGITGMMLYADGSIIQAIEGPEEAVLDLWSRLGEDSRHRDQTMVTHYEIAKRQFPDWSMFCRRLSNPTADDITELFASLDQPVFDPDNDDMNSVARKLLEGFRTRNDV